MRLRALELLVEPAERRAAIACDIAGGVEAGATVTLLLHQAQANERLKAGDKDRRLGEIVLVVERDRSQHHFRWPLLALRARRTIPNAGATPLEIFGPHAPGNVSALIRQPISLRGLRKHGNFQATMRHAVFALRQKEHAAPPENAGIRWARPVTRLSHWFAVRADLMLVHTSQTGARAGFATLPSGRLRAAICAMSASDKVKLKRSRFSLTRSGFD